MFQIQDDVLEATSSVETMMKSKSDDHNQKATFVSQLGLETAQSEIERLFASVQMDLKRLHLENPLIEQLLMQIYQRKY
jgi:geranylgeranyl pyrophosphate synthase